MVSSLPKKLAKGTICNIQQSASLSTVSKALDAIAWKRIWCEKVQSGFGVNRGSRLQSSGERTPAGCYNCSAGLTENLGLLHVIFGETEAFPNNRRACVFSAQVPLRPQFSSNVSVAHAMTVLPPPTLSTRFTTSTTSSYSEMGI